MTKRLITLVTTLAVFGLANAENPLQDQNKTSSKQAIELHEKVAGTVWTYPWRGKSYDFRFSKDSTIAKLETGWTDTTWKTVGPRDILIEGADNAILLSFNEDTSSFKTFDWDHQPASGKPKTETLQSRTKLNSWTPKEIQKLVQTRGREITKIDQKYRSDLEKLRSKYAKLGDTETLNLLAAVKAAMDPVKNKGAQDRHWVWRSGGELMLKANGKARHSKWPREGTWSLFPDGAIKLEGPTGSFRIHFQGDVGYVQHLEKGGSTTISPKH